MMALAAAILALGLQAPPPAVAAAPRLDPKAVARTVDGLGSVRAGTMPLFRADVAVSSVSVDLGASPAHLSLRRQAEGIELLGTANAGGRTEVLASVAPVGDGVAWGWRGVSAEAFSAALSEADAALPGMVVTMLLADGRELAATLPPQSLRAAPRTGSPAKVRLFRPGSRPLRVAVPTAPSWQVDAGTDGGFTLEHDLASVGFALDAASGMLTVTLMTPASKGVALAQEQLAARRRELAGAQSPGEHEVLRREVAQLEESLRAARAAAQPKGPQEAPPLPRLSVVDAAGREFATLEVVLK